MGFLNLFGTMLAGAAITPIALLPPSCTVTTETNVPASTDIRTSTLTYNGPFPPGPFSAFEVSVTTYTVVVPTEGPGGEIQSQTYTFIASPIVEPVPPTSLPTSPPVSAASDSVLFCSMHQMTSNLTCYDSLRQMFPAAPTLGALRTWV